MASAILPSIAGSFETKKKKRRPAQNQRGDQDDHVYRDSVCSRHDGIIEPIVWLLYNTNTDSIRLGGRLLAALGASSVFYSLSTLSNSILQAVGKASKPVTNAVIALAVQTVVAAAFLIFTDLGIYSLPIAVTVYSFMMCLLNGIAVKKSNRLSSGNREDVCPAAGILCDHGACGCRYLLWADADSAERISRQCGCTAAFRWQSADLAYFAAALKAWRHVEKELLGIPGGMIMKFCDAFAEELGRKFVIR